MYQFYGLAYNFPRLKGEETDNLNRQITRNKIGAIIKKLPTNRSPGPDGFMGEFCQTFKDLIPILLNLFQNVNEEGAWMNLNFII